MREDNVDAALKFLHPDDLSELDFSQTVFGLKRRADMWAVFYEHARVSRPYPNKASAFRDAIKAGIADRQTSELDDGYEIREIKKDDS